MAYRPYRLAGETSSEAACRLEDELQHARHAGAPAQIRDALGDAADQERETAYAHAE